MERDRGGGGGGKVYKMGVGRVGGRWGTLSSSIASFQGKARPPGTDVHLSAYLAQNDSISKIAERLARPRQAVERVHLGHDGETERDDRGVR